jgi:hypothetical protein
MTAPVYRVRVDLTTGVQEQIALTPEEIATLNTQDPLEFPELSFAQMLIGLVTLGWITEVEGQGWIEGTLPADVEAYIASLPPEVRFAARAKVSRPSSIIRTDPYVNALAMLKNKQPEEVNQFFMGASQF